MKLPMGVSRDRHAPHFLCAGAGRPAWSSRKQAVCRPRLPLEAAPQVEHPTAKVGQSSRSLASAAPADAHDRYFRCHRVGAMMPSLMRNYLCRRSHRRKLHFEQKRGAVVEQHRRRVRGVRDRLGAAINRACGGSA